MEPFHVTVRFPNIEPSKLADFKRAAAELIEISRREPGTLRYDYYLNADETVCVVHELFADSAACLSHLVGVGARLGR
jgi:quinol monooxygenase YgiN